MHASRLEFCLVFIIFQAMLVLRMCGNGTQNLLISVSAALFYTCGSWHSCGHGSVQMICGLLACKQRDGEAISVKRLVWRLPGLPDLLYRPWHWGYLCSPSLPSRLCTFGSPSLDLFSICSTSLTVVKFCPSTGVSKHFLSGCNAKCFEMLLVAKTLLSQEIQLGLPEDGPDYKTK